MTAGDERVPWLHTVTCVVNEPLAELGPEMLVTTRSGPAPMPMRRGADTLFDSISSCTDCGPSTRASRFTAPVCGDGKPLMLTTSQAPAWR